MGKIRESLVGPEDLMTGAAVDAASESGDRDLTNSTPTGWPLLRFSRRAMASDFEISFNRGQYPQAAEAALAALDEVERLESVLSAFQSESEISRINRDAARQALATSSEVWNLLKRCQQLAQETDGAVDMTASTLWRLWGFAKREGKVPSQEEIAAALQNVGQRFVLLDDLCHQRDPAETCGVRSAACGVEDKNNSGLPTAQSVRFTKPGVEISLGCIGKGAALDSAAGKLRDLEIEHALLHGGRSSILAIGGRMQERWSQSAQQRFPPHVSGTLLEPTRDRSVGWTVGISHPIRPGPCAGGTSRRIAEVRLAGMNGAGGTEALGTSGSQHQFFIHQGKRYSHIIDPRSDKPAEGLLLATVIAPTAALADALSTAFYVLQPEQTAEYCRRHPGVAALLVLPGESPFDNVISHDCRILHFGFEQNQIRFFCQTRNGV